jgi:hypothetical protein
MSEGRSFRVWPRSNADHVIKLELDTCAVALVTAIQRENRDRRLSMDHAAVGLLSHVFDLTLEATMEALDAGLERDAYGRPATS